LSKKAKKGFHGWPVATVAWYGPDDITATKVAVAIMPAKGAEPTDLQRWLSQNQTDLRNDNGILQEVLSLIAEAEAICNGS
jgi:hypothetical protein